MANTDRKELIRQRMRARGWKPLTGPAAKPVLDSALGRGFFSLVPMHVDPASVEAKWIMQADKPAEKAMGKRKPQKVPPP